MRPAITFLNIQLSNSRDSDLMKLYDNNQYFQIWVRMFLKYLFLTYITP